MAETAVAGNVPFVWEGTDRKGKKVKGKSLAASEAAVRADLRRDVADCRLRRRRPAGLPGSGIGGRGAPVFDLDSVTVQIMLELISERINAA